MQTTKVTNKPHDGLWAHKDAKPYYEDNSIAKHSQA